MTKLVLILLIAATAAMPADTKKKGAKKTEAAAAPVAPAPPVVKPLVIPPDATQNPDGTWSYTDKQGKHWIFNKTPFGLSRIEDMSASPGGAPAAATVSKEQFTTATDAGDSVKFVRKTPFGETKWEKKKTDLTDEERAVLARQQSNQQ